MQNNYNNARKLLCRPGTVCGNRIKKKKNMEKFVANYGKVCTQPSPSVSIEVKNIYQFGPRGGLLTHHESLRATNISQIKPIMKQR